MVAADTACAPCRERIPPATLIVPCCPHVPLFQSVPRVVPPKLARKLGAICKAPLSSEVVPEWDPVEKSARASWDTTALVVNDQEFGDMPFPARSAPLRVTV